MLVVRTLTAVLLRAAATMAGAAHEPDRVTSFAIGPVTPTTIYAGSVQTSAPVVAVVIDAATPATLYAGMTAERDD